MVPRKSRNPNLRQNRTVLQRSLWLDRHHLRCRCSHDSFSLEGSISDITDEKQKRTMFNGTTKMRTEKTTIDVVNVVLGGAWHLHSGCWVLPANGCGLEPWAVGAAIAFVAVDAGRRRRDGPL